MKELMVEELLGGEECILFKQKRTNMKEHLSGAKKRRVMPRLQEKVLDAPELMDDFSLNVVDWQQDNGIVAIALTNKVYIWNYYTQQ